MTTDDRMSRDFELLRDRVVILERQQAVREESMKSVDARLLHIENILSRLTWLVIGGIIAAAMAFMIGGGFNVPP